MNSRLATCAVGVILVGAATVIVISLERSLPKKSDLMGVWLGDPATRRDDSSIVIEFQDSGRFRVRWDSDLVGSYHYEMLDEWRINSDLVELNYEMVFDSGNRFRKGQVFRYSVSGGNPSLTLIADQDGEITGARKGAVTLSRVTNASARGRPQKTKIGE